MNKKTNSTRITVDLLLPRLLVEKCQKVASSKGLSFENFLIQILEQEMKTIRVPKKSTQDTCPETEE